MDEARAVNDEVKVNAPIRIMRKEQDWKQHRRMYCAFGKEKRKAPGQIAVRCPTGPDQIFSEQEEVERAGADYLTDCYTPAHLLPFVSGRLLDNIGHCGQGPAVQSILNDTYEFPPEYST